MRMKQIYFDNGSTSFPKAPGLGEVMGKHIDCNGYNISRGGYGKAYDLEGEIIEAREVLCELFNCDNPKNIIFTPGATIGLNMILKGILRKGDHVITTSMEHNAVARPLSQLKEEGVSWSEASCDENGELDIKGMEALIRPETKLILSIHGSNVCGSVMPVEKIGKLCRRRGILFCIDASQTAGSLDIDVKKLCADAVVFPGHKALMGPQGIGGMIITDEMAERMIPLFSGGTGSISDMDIMPDFLPDKFQPGTLNLPGIIGLKHAVEYIKREGFEKIAEKKKRITVEFLEAAADIRGVRIIGPPAGHQRCSVVSLDFADRDNAEIAFLLENEYGIMTRCGLHCAPHAHRTLGTFPRGTVRFSFGYFNTINEVKTAAHAINKVMNG